MTVKALLVIFFTITQIFNTLSLPTLSSKCSLEDSKCLTSKANELLPIFVQGNSELGIEKLDKMFIDYIKIDQGGLIQVIKNLEVEGLKNATIEKVSFNMPLKVMQLTFSTSMVMKSESKFDGVFLAQPIYGDGRMTLTIKNVLTEMFLIFNIAENDDHKHYIEFFDYRYAFYIKGGVDYDLENVYNGDKKKSDILHSFLHENWKIISALFAKDLTDRINDNIFNAIKTYMRSQPLEEIALYPQ